MEKHYTVKEVAALTGYKEGTIRNKILDGDIQSTKIGRSVRIKESDLKKFLGLED